MNSRLRRNDRGFEPEVCITVIGAIAARQLFVVDRLVARNRNTNSEEHTKMRLKSVVATTTVILLAITVVSSGLAQDVEKYHSTTSESQSKSGSAEGCVLMPIPLLDKMFGEKFDDANSLLDEKSPPPFDGSWGRHCEFRSAPPFAKGHEMELDFTVYVEASTAEAKQTFEKLAGFMEDKSKPAPSGLGDRAYWQSTDPKHLVLYVLRGKAHYSVGGEPKDVSEKQLIELARAVSAQL